MQEYSVGGIGGWGKAVVVAAKGEDGTTAGWGADGTTAGWGTAEGLKEVARATQAAGGGRGGRRAMGRVASGEAARTAAAPGGKAQAGAGCAADQARQRPPHLREREPSSASEAEAEAEAEAETQTQTHTETAAETETETAAAAAAGFRRPTQEIKHRSFSNFEALFIRPETGAAHHGGGASTDLHVQVPVRGG